MDQNASLSGFYGHDAMSNGCSERSTDRRFKLALSMLMYGTALEDLEILDFGSGPARILEHVKPERYVAIDARLEVLGLLKCRGIECYPAVPKDTKYNVVLSLGACSEAVNGATISYYLGVLKDLWENHTKIAMLVNVPRLETDVVPDRALLQYSVQNMTDLIDRCRPKKFALDVMTLPHQYFLAMFKE